MNARIIAALVRRHTILYSRNAPRVVELFFWPTMDLLVWGFVTTYLLKVRTGAPPAITFLLGAMIFWDILYRAQQGVTISYLEEVWSRNLLNIFVAPVKLSEFIAATYVVGMIKVLVIVSVLTGMAFCFYSFNLLSLGLALIPLFANLLLLGWSMGLMTTALLLRWGQAAEALAWAIPFAIQPISAVFYPVSILPPWIQPLALLLPSTHVFEGMRQVLKGEGLSTEHLCWAFGLNIFYALLAAWLFQTMFQEARKKGRLTRMLS
jgi:ABC-2 type transport system permease protein